MRFRLPPPPRLRFSAAVLATALPPVLLLLCAVSARPAAAQEAPPDSLPLSLPAATARATQQSEEVRLARSQLDLAGARVTNARSAILPHLNANLGYTRTFSSSFDTGGGGGMTVPDSLRFNPDPTAPLDERVRYLERNVPNAVGGALGGLFGDLPFGRENNYSAALSASQTLFAGGRVRSGIQAAHDAVEAAQHSLTQQEAGIRLQVRGAYYQALLARALVTSSDSALAQAQRFLAQQRLRLKYGRASELDVLRAEVNLENLRPQLVQARNSADLAARNLKRLANIPLDRPLRLTTRLTAPAPQELNHPTLSPAARTVQRAALKAAESQVHLRGEQVDIQKAAYWPSVSLSMNYGKQLYPSGILNFDGDWRTNLTASLGVQVPLFQGLQRKAQVNEAQAQLTTARLQRDQLQEASKLQYQQALNEKQRAAALIQARRRTVDQAQRVYDLTVLRYNKGRTTQLQVSDARLSLLQARTNLAQALTDFYTAGTSLANALGTGGSLSGGTGGSTGGGTSGSTGGSTGGSSSAAQGGGAMTARPAPSGPPTATPAPGPPGASSPGGNR